MNMPPLFLSSEKDDKSFVFPAHDFCHRLPLTLHFRSWERQEALPSVSASFFVLWPPAVQVSQAVSYPAELLQEWATTAARKIAVPSKEALQVLLLL